MTTCVSSDKAQFEQRMFGLRTFHARIIPRNGPFRTVPVSINPETFAENVTDFLMHAVVHNADMGASRAKEQALIEAKERHVKNWAKDLYFSAAKQDGGFRRESFLFRAVHKIGSALLIAGVTEVIAGVFTAFIPSLLDFGVMTFTVGFASAAVGFVFGQFKPEFPWRVDEGIKGVRNFLGGIFEELESVKNLREAV